MLREYYGCKIAELYLTIYPPNLLYLYVIIGNLHMNDYSDILLPMLSLVSTTWMSGRRLVSLFIPDLEWIWFRRPHTVSFICKDVQRRLYSNICSIASKIKVAQGNIIAVNHNFCLLFWQSKFFSVFNFLSRIFLAKKTVTLPIRAHLRETPLPHCRTLPESGESTPTGDSHNEKDMTQPLPVWMTYAMTEKASEHEWLSEA